MSRILFVLLFVTLMTTTSDCAERPLPNVVVIYADDIGYGDLGCYGGTGAKTPHVDRLAKEGRRFTSGYCSSATCTPSRYSLITGEYAFRRKGTGVLPGDAALLIEPGRATLPQLMRAAGLRTGVVGKWHLGMGRETGTQDWNGAIAPGPNDVGFDESFILAATGDRVPCVYIENQKVVGLNPADPISVSYKESFPGEPNGIDQRQLLTHDWSHGHNMAIVNGIGRIGYTKGGKAALWKDEDMADVFTRRAVDFVTRHKDQPFFLFFSTHDIHVPRVPHSRFVGTSKMGPRGDALVQFDWSVGEILRTLDELGLADNTLVLLSSDNGPVLDDGYQDQAVEALGDHKPAGPLNGGKYSLYEGGTRVPFLARWPGRVKPGESPAMISQVDLCATLGRLVGSMPDAKSSPDSRDLLPVLLGETDVGRDHIIEHANRLAIRSGKWKLIPGTDPRAKKAQPPQLYDLDTDLGETTNIVKDHPEIVTQMLLTLERVRSSPDSKP
jgi:arylsulfatase A-like enzyme